MKRFFQFVVFALALVVASQPLLVDAVCPQQQCGGTPDYSVHFDSMAIPNLAMWHILTSSQATQQVVFGEAGCSYGPCWLQSDSATLLMATPPILKLASSKLLMRVPKTRSLGRSPGTSSSRSSEFKYLPAISAHVTALGLTALEACFAPKPELCRRFP
jgi:hypothetical protein